MRRFVARMLGFFVAACVLLLVATYLASPWLIKQALPLLSAEAGVQITLQSGHVQLPGPALVLEGLQIRSNQPGDAAQDALTVGRLGLGVSIADLAKGRLSIDALHIENADLRPSTIGTLLSGGGDGSERVRFSPRVVELKRVAVTTEVLPKPLTVDRLRLTLEPPASQPSAPPRFRLDVGLLGGELSAAGTVAGLGLPPARPGEGFELDVVYELEGLALEAVAAYFPPAAAITQAIGRFASQGELKVSHDPRQGQLSVEHEGRAGLSGLGFGYSRWRVGDSNVDWQGRTKVAWPFLGTPDIRATGVALASRVGVAMADGESVTEDLRFEGELSLGIGARLTGELTARRFNLSAGDTHRLRVTDVIAGVDAVRADSSKIATIAVGEMGADSVAYETGQRGWVAEKFSVQEWRASDRGLFSAKRLEVDDLRATDGLLAMSGTAVHELSGSPDGAVGVARVDIARVASAPSTAAVSDLWLESIALEELERQADGSAKLARARAGDGKVELAQGPVWLSGLSASGLARGAKGKIGLAEVALEQAFQTEGASWESVGLKLSEIVHESGVDASPRTQVAAMGMDRLRVGGAEAKAVKAAGMVVQGTEAVRLQRASAHSVAGRESTTSWGLTGPRLREAEYVAGGIWRVSEFRTKNLKFADAGSWEFDDVSLVAVESHTPVRMKELRASAMRSVSDEGSVREAKALRGRSVEVIDGGLVAQDLESDSFSYRRTSGLRWRTSRPQLSKFHLGWSGACKASTFGFDGLVFHDPDEDLSWEASSTESRDFSYDGEDLLRASRVNVDAIKLAPDEGQAWIVSEAELEGLAWDFTDAATAAVLLVARLAPDVADPDWGVEALRIEEAYSSDAVALKAKILDVESAHVPFDGLHMAQAQAQDLEILDDGAIDAAQIIVRGLAMGLGESVPRLRVSKLIGRGLSVLPEVRTELDSVEADGFKIWMGLDETGTLRLPAKLGSPESRSDTPKPGSMAVGVVKVGGDSAVVFQDLSIPRPFVTALNHIDLELKGLDSARPGSEATFEVTGAFSPFARLDAQGQVANGSLRPDLDLVAELTGLDLTEVSPYLEHYEGARVIAGHGDAAVTLKLEDGVLRGNADLLLNRFDVKTVSGGMFKSETGLVPLSLLVKIAKDGDGNIEINTPIETRVDAQKFRISAFLARRLHQTMQLAVAIPAGAAELALNVLGVLPRGSKKLLPVPFVMGEDYLGAVALGALDGVAARLDREPKLRLRVCPRVTSQDEGRRAADDIANARVAMVRKYLSASSVAPHRLLPCPVVRDSDSDAKPRIEFEAVSAAG